MENSMIEKPSQQTVSILKILTSCIGVIFLLVGIGLALVFAISAYNFLKQPEYFISLMEYVKTQEPLLAEWVLASELESIKLSNIFTLAIIVIALCMILKIIIGFITMCISSGKSFLNLSRNFGD